MNTKYKSTFILATILFVGMGFFSEAGAVTIRVKCDVWTKSPLQSKASVDGYGLTGKFYAQVKSGGVIKSSKVQAADSNHEIDFDFDSKKSSVNQGATEIPATFIKNNYLIGYIRRSDTKVIVAAASATCTPH